MILPTAKQLIWFIALWVFGVACLGVAGFALKLFL